MKTICERLNTLLLVLFCILGLSFSISAAETERDSLKLRSQDQSGNTAFSVTNMFPGDAETKDFTVKVSHRKPITLYYHADIRPGFEKLAEVMMVKIYIPSREEMLYDGLMRDMPSAVALELAADEREVVYRITAYLDTSVGNDYQYKTLIADFRWWYTEESGGGFPDIPDFPDPDKPKPTDPAPVKLVAEKILDGRYPRGKDFTFILWDDSGRELQRVRNRDGLVEFTTFTLSEAGTYIYYITEQPGNDKDMLYDATRYKVIVTVTKSGDQYIAQVCCEKNGEPYCVLPRFVNRTNAVETDTAATAPDTAEPTPTEPDTVSPTETQPTPPETNFPAQETQPTADDDPASPGTPGPTDSGKPETQKPTPDTPSEPDAPDDPEETIESAETVPEEQPDMPDNPKTGDRTLWYLPLLLLLTIMVCLWMAFAKRRKQ